MPNQPDFIDEGRKPDTSVKRPNFFDKTVLGRYSPETVHDIPDNEFYNMTQDEILNYNANQQAKLQHNVTVAVLSVLCIVAVIALFGYLSRNYQKIVDFFQEKKASNDRANIYEKAQADYLHTKIISEMAKEDTKFELAAKMKKEGLDAEMIKRLTQLSDEEIANL